jgi:hypothetical protein
LFVGDLGILFILVGGNDVACKLDSIQFMIWFICLARRKGRLKKYGVDLSVGTCDSCPPVAERGRAHKRDS